MPKYDETLCFDGIEENYAKLFDLRDDVMKALEIARTDKLIGKSLDAKLTIWAPHADTYATLTSFAPELEDIFIVSGVTVLEGSAPTDAYSETVSGIGVKVEPADGEKCDRCWKYSTETHNDGESCLCSRCKSVVG